MPAVVARLRGAGLFRYFQPHRYGGFEMAWGTQYLLAKELARGCPSTAWVVALCGQLSCHAARFPREAQQEIWGATDDVILCQASPPKKGARVRRVRGGFVLDGPQGFTSGIDHATWCLAAGRIEGEGPEMWHFLLPRRDYRIRDNWRTIGMRGTGTKDMVTDGAFVPDHRALRFEDFQRRPPGASCNPGYIYAMEMGPHVLGSSPLGPAVGIAEAALADYIAITRQRVSLVLGTPVGDSDLVQVRLAESAAEIHAADLIARTDLALLHRRGVARRRLTEREKIDVQRNRGFIAELCMRSVARLVRMMGAMGVFDDNPLNRYYRDIHTMTTQVGVAWDTTMPHWGRWALGLPPRGVMAPRPVAGPKE